MRRHPAALGAESGISLLELVATCTLLVILASAVFPLARVTVQRQREIELRRALRDIRRAIDAYHAAADPALPAPQKLQPKHGTTYPPELDALVEGQPVIGTLGLKVKFLRRIPRDPMTNSTEWGQRCYEDEPEEDSWCGTNVWDVYTKAEGKGLDGTPYREW